jgi:selenocysteine lyase/cysteine desulfurase
MCGGLAATTSYHAIAATLRHVHALHPHTVLSTFALTFATTRAALLSAWRAHLRALPRAAPSADNPRPKAVAVLDSIASVPGALLPWEEMVRICREERVWSVVDGAHSVGQEALDLGAAQPDFFVSVRSLRGFSAALVCSCVGSCAQNCHKWLYAKRGCAFLYVPARNRHVIKSTLPTSGDYDPVHGSLEQWHDMFECASPSHFSLSVL